MKSRILLAAMAAMILVGVPAAGMHLPGEGEGRSMPEEIGRWNEVGPRYGLEVVGPPLPE